MKANYLIYFLLKLINEGHKWQYKTLNNNGGRPTFWFSNLQICALIVASIFIFKSPLGFSNDLIDYIISSLSILTGLYLSLVIFINDKFKDVEWDKIEGSDKIHQWSFYSQFNALTSYSILIAITVIVILFGKQMLGTETNIMEYEWTNLSVSSAIIFFKNTFVVVIRFITVYFLLDFFILCVYTVISLFHYTNRGMEKYAPKEIATKEISINQSLKEKFGWQVKLVIIITAVICFLAIIYLFA